MRWTLTMLWQKIAKKKKKLLIVFLYLLFHKYFQLSQRSTIFLFSYYGRKDDYLWNLWYIVFVYLILYTYVIYILCTNHTCMCVKPQLLKEPRKAFKSEKRTKFHFKLKLKMRNMEVWCPLSQVKWILK